MSPVPETKRTVGWKFAAGEVLNVEATFVTVLVNCVWNAPRAWDNAASTLFMAAFIAPKACVNALVNCCVAIIPIPGVADVVEAPVVADVDLAPLPALLSELAAVLI